MTDRGREGDKGREGRESGKEIECGERGEGESFT